jgi:hypothetical protein
MTIELGGNIQLVGFKEIDRGSLVIVKKIVGNYVKQFATKDPKFQRFTLSLKIIHPHEENGEKVGKHELHAKLVGEREHNAEIVDYNLMFAIDKVMKKIESSMA